MMKLVAMASLNSPILKPLPRAPMDWALSSISLSLCLSAIFLMAVMSAHWP